MDRQALIAELKALKFDAAEYVVVGGGAMCLRGLRETDDIDLVVTPALFDVLALAGWELKRRPNGKPGLHRGCVEAYLDVNTPTFERSTSHLFHQAQVIDGIRCADLESLIGWKRSYGREKDLRDVQMLEAHRGEQEFIALVLRNPNNAAILAALRELDLPQGYLVAGCLFQTVWNVLSGEPPAAHIRDYDVFYFDSSDTSWEAEDEVIRRVTSACAPLGVHLEVRNQARVHLWYARRFGIPCEPLTSTHDGVDHFLNQSSCFGMRQTHAGHEVYAPFGFDDLLAMRLRPNPRRHLPRVYAEKAARWSLHWPRLQVLPWQDASS